MKVIIIEDEKLNAEHLTNMLKRIDSNIEVVGSADSVKKSVELFKSGIKSDLIFLDIHLSDGNSFEIFNHTTIESPVIFTTAYNEYALKAFKYNSVDYLLKPIDILELKNALDKFSRQKKSADLSSIEKLMESLNKGFKKRFLVKSGNQILSVKAGEINNFTSEDGYTIINSTANKKYIIDFTLDQLETMVDPVEFFRLNRQCILNINSIDKIEPYLNSRLKITAKGLSEESSIISRERVSDFKNWLGQ